MLSKPQTSFLKSLHQKKFRQMYRKFLAEGEKCVSELLASNFNIHAIYATADWADANPQTITTIITQAELEAVSTLATPNKVMAVAEIPQELETPGTITGLALYLDGINDPGNLGTIIRTADWFGITHIFCSHDCVDAYNPKVVSSTMGSLFHVQIQYTDFEAVLAANQNVQVYGADIKGTNLYTTTINYPALLAIGSESHGIKQPALQQAATMLKIPGYGKAESLNAGVAAGIMCGEMVRKYRLGEG
jgi:TrmH family RNA methyltransferase